jgi:hypothetical protein
MDVAGKHPPAMTPVERQRTRRWYRCHQRGASAPARLGETTVLHPGASLLILRT